MTEHILRHTTALMMYAVCLTGLLCCWPAVANCACRPQPPSAYPTSKGHMLKAYRSEKAGGYNFWIYTPAGYDTISQPVPVVIFLHGASLCGRNLERVRRYGPLDAVAKGRNIPAVIIAPQNPGGAWAPQKVIDILTWTEQHYNVDSTRVYALGMSLGGYGTLDLAGTFPDKIAAAMALCGGCTLKDQQRLGELPLWIMHGTADRAIPVRYSKVVVEGMISRQQALRLRYNWLPGASHGALARIFYLPEAYEWLFKHSLSDETRPVSHEVNITLQTMSHAYKDLSSRLNTLTVVPL